MSVVGASLAGATSWGAYLLWGWGSKAITPESWDDPLEIVGRIGLYGLGYGLFIPTGAATGVIVAGISAGERRSSWGAHIGGYVGAAASVPFAVMVQQEPTWGKAALTASSIIVLPSLCAWLGYRLTPLLKDEQGASSGLDIQPYAVYDGEQASVGLCLRF
jgi:hypothetical protein